MTTLLNQEYINFINFSLIKLPTTLVLSNRGQTEVQSSANHYMAGINELWASLKYKTIHMINNNLLYL